jgi:transposase
MTGDMAELLAMREALAAASKRIAELEAERDVLRCSYENLRLELELLKRRLFVAKAERAHDVLQLTLELEMKQAALDKMAGTLGMAQGDEAPGENKPENAKPARDGKPKGKREHGRGTGRRQLKDLKLTVVEVKIEDAYLELLVQRGKIEHHGWEPSDKLGQRRASKVLVRVMRRRYKAVDATGDTDAITTAMPPEMLPRSIIAPSLAAHLIHENVGKGMPLFRVEDALIREGAPVDRGTLARMKKKVGDALAPTVVRAMREHALATAFCISTDCTGVNVQPLYSHEKGAQPCKKGSFIVFVADRDHILYDYLDKEDGRAVHARFRGFSGYVQADAKAVHNLLFADPAELQVKAREVEHDGCTRVEVGCWYHCRRRFWEAASAKCRVAQEGLMRIGRIFELDGSWKDEPPSRIKALREQFLRAHVEDFFTWVEQQWTSFGEQRGYTRTALGYARNQRVPLTRFFDDGRLVLTNNGAERALKTIALGRKAWLFCGSDDHATSTAALYSLIASARLHKIDVEDYLRCLIRLVPLWPSDRMLELAPLCWERTKARLDPNKLAEDLGPIAIPDLPLDLAAAEQKSMAG